METKSLLSSNIAAKPGELFTDQELSAELLFASMFDGSSENSAPKTSLAERKIAVDDGNQVVS